MTQTSLFASCPSCGESVHVDQGTCPHCGQQAFDSGVISPLPKTNDSDKWLRDALTGTSSNEAARDRDYLNTWTEGNGSRIAP
jgi:hypothetical protein